MGLFKFYPEHAELLGRDCVTCGKHLYDGNTGSIEEPRVMLSGRKTDPVASARLRREEEERERMVDAFLKTHAVCVDSIAADIMAGRYLARTPYSPRMHTCGQCVACYSKAKR
jgi:hypothetical protein